MNYFFLALATVTSATNSLLWKKTSSDTRDDRILHIKSAFIFALSTVIVLLYALIARAPLLPSSFTLLLAVLFAISKTAQQAALLFAMRIGATSITQLIFSLGILFPVFYGAIALSEEISLIQYLGMALFFLALCFIVNPKADKSFRPLWLILSLLAATSSGINAVLQKLHQASEASEELVSFVVLSLLLSSLFSLGLSGVEALRSARKCAKDKVIVCATVGTSDENTEASCIEIATADTQKALGFKRSILITLLFLGACGVCVGLQTLLNFTLAGRLPAVIHFPIYNIGSMVLVGFGGRLFYGERLSGHQLIGFAIGCAAIICIGLF